MYIPHLHPCLLIAGLIAAVLIGTRPAGADPIDLSHAVIVTRGNSAPLPERTAATVLSEEIEKRSGIKLSLGMAWPAEGWAIGIVSGKEGSLHGHPVPASARIEKAEGFGIATDTSDAHHPVLWIAGADARGTMFGVGRLLTTLECRQGAVALPEALNLTTSPAYSIRGHQLGYRGQANSYDAWSPEQFDQYIRELTFFGTNAIEGIPFNDDRPTVNPYPREKMNVDISRSCERYGLDYWVWVPADFDLAKNDLRSAALKRHEDLFRTCPTLTGIFVAGGDPGDNDPSLVIPYLADLAKLLARFHPNARVWLSMQGYSPTQQDYVYRWIERDQPAWLGGLVAGPSSPPLADLRARLPRKYPIRDYPDITHSVRCQFPVPYWDPAFAFTLGRECTNPRPLFFSRVFHDTAAFTNGFISYSDGIHDDVNKVLWSAMAWNPSVDLNTVLTDYSRVFFSPDVASAAAAGIFAQERNWDGALATNGGVDATFALWHGLEQQAPALKSNWRWQMCLLRAYYDLYQRRRLVYESRLEDEANAAMLTASTAESSKAIDSALAILKRAETEPVSTDLCARVTQLCDDLWHSIGLQSSVERYHASGSERGCVLDFVNYPLNNRWWLEDELTKVRAMDTETARVERLKALATWENPGTGSYYDDIGNIAKSPHEVRNERMAGPLLDVDNANLPEIMFWVGGDKLARARQSWFTDETWPTAMKYPSLDPQADYVVRTSGCGDCFLRANGLRIAPTKDGKNVGDIKEFPIPRGLYRDGNLTITFDPTFEPNLNWRVQSRIMEIWVIKK